MCTWWYTLARRHAWLLDLQETCWQLETWLCGVSSSHLPSLACWFETLEVYVVVEWMCSPLEGCNVCCKIWSCTKSHHQQVIPCSSFSSSSFQVLSIPCLICDKVLLSFVLLLQEAEPSHNLQVIFKRLPLPIVVHDFDLPRYIFEAVRRLQKRPPSYCHIRRSILSTSWNRTDYVHDSIYLFELSVILTGNGLGLTQSFLRCIYGEKDETPARRWEFGVHVQVNNWVHRATDVCQRLPLRVACS